MAKVKYRYNPETLSYDRIVITFRERLKKWGIMFAASIVISVMLPCRVQIPQSFARNAELLRRLRILYRVYAIL